MSFEIYLQCFERGRPGGIPRDAVKTLFPIVEAESEANYWKVWYDDTNYCHISVTPLTIDPSQLYALCVSRPCDDHRLWDSIFSIMGLGAVTLYFPGSAPPLVRSTIAGAQLPADMIEAMGKPRIVHSTTEILEIIQHA